MRAVLANQNLEKYLKKCSEESKFSFGLIIGQPTSQEKDFIVHLARNIDGVEDSLIVEEYNGAEVIVNDFADNELNHGLDGLSYESSVHNNNINDVDVNSFSNHVISVTKMIPGSFYVLGMFVVDSENIFDNEEYLKSAKKLLLTINSVLKHNKYLCGSLPCATTNNQKILLCYSTSTQNATCKYFEPKDGFGYFMPADLKFLEKSIEWFMIEANYELDDVFPIIEHDKKINIENHFGMTLEIITTYIENSEIFIHSEPVDNTIILENFIKQNQINSCESLKSFKASLFLPATPSTKDPIIIEKFEGLIRFSGIIASRIWTHPKNTIGDIEKYIRNDILRSLAARIQIYCDGLIDPHVANEGIVINEPPRRVFFDLPEGGGIQFSEYIFRGETPSVCAAQAKDILDLEISPDNITDNLEGFPTEFDEAAVRNLGSRSTDSVLNVIKHQGYGKMVYLAGLIIATLVLIMSISLHFYLR